jgi:DNA adenine methylase
MVDYLPEIHQRFSRVIVEHLDIRDLLKKYNKKDIFFYLDPPYVHSSRKSTARYNCEMSDEDHKEMLNLLLTHNSKFCISGYDNPLYNILSENGWFKYSFKSPSSESIETLWWNYPL